MNVRSKKNSAEEFGLGCCQQLPARNHPNHGRKQSAAEERLKGIFWGSGSSDSGSTSCSGIHIDRSFNLIERLQVIMTKNNNWKDSWFYLSGNPIIVNSKYQFHGFDHRNSSLI